MGPRRPLRTVLAILVVFVTASAFAANPIVIPGLEGPFAVADGFQTAAQVARGGGLDGAHADLGTGYGHVAYAVDDLAATLAALKQQGIEPEREPYRVREGGSRICFVRDPDGYRVELIDRSGR